MGYRAGADDGSGGDADGRAGPASQDPAVLRDARGYEVQFATNHLDHFQLTLGLFPALRAAHGARVVNTTSGAKRMSGSSPGTSCRA